MLRLTNEKRTYDVPITIGGEETIFVLRSMSIASRQELLHKVQSLGTEDGNDDSFGILVNALSGEIVEIKGHEGDPKAVLLNMEFVSDLIEVSNGIIGFAGMNGDEAKNLLSSSGQGIPDSAGSVATSAGKEGERVSTTPTKTAP